MFHNNSAIIPPPLISQPPATSFASSKYEVVFICSLLRKEFLVKLFKIEPPVSHSCQCQVRKYFVKAKHVCRGRLKIPGRFTLPRAMFGSRKSPVDYSHYCHVAIWEKLRVPWNRRASPLSWFSFNCKQNKQRSCGTPNSGHFSILSISEQFSLLKAT